LKFKLYIIFLLFQRLSCKIYAKKEEIRADKNHFNQQITGRQRFKNKTNLNAYLNSVRNKSNREKPN